MGFNDDIFQLTGGKGYKSVKSDTSSDNNENTTENPIAAPKIEKASVSKSQPTEHRLHDQDYVIESDLVTPVVKAVRNKEEKPLIVVVDDDFETLDLMEIYLNRNYTYKGFSGPREAVFYMNQHVPEIIFLDCKIHTMKAATFIDIIRSGKGNEKVPFVLLGEEYEIKEFTKGLLPKGVIGTITKPVARGKLQEYIDGVVKKNMNRD